MQVTGRFERLRESIATALTKVELRRWYKRRGAAVNTDEASLAHLPLTSYCVAGFLTGHGLVLICGPGGWEPLSQSILHWASRQIMSKDQFDPSHPPSSSSTRSSPEYNSSPHFLPHLPKWWSLLPLTTLSPLIQNASDSVKHHWFIKFLGAGVGWGMKVCVSVSDMYEFQKNYT